ncbi:MAG: protein kinase [Phycisphaerales bacterium]|nr:MAG: protein kinase [Phycisphaerales bacterium]
MSDAGRRDKNKRDKEVAPTADTSGPSLAAGSRIGHFEIEREIGRGGMGVVYLARDTRLKRAVAIKSLPPEVAGNPQVRSRLQREARLLASVNHPNVATIHEEFEEAGSETYLVLEYVPGQTLAEKIATGKLTLSETVSVACQIASALGAAHEHGVIHRDLKPGNIKITPEGTVKVLDFGLAKALEMETQSAKSTLTQVGRVMGTPAYMSPEQARGEPVDHRTDIWSLGVLIYEMLTGQLPFKGETQQAVTHSILHREPEHLTHVRRDAPRKLEHVLSHMMQKDPAKRYDTISALATDLSGLRREVDASSNGPRRKLRLVAVAAVVAVCIGVAALLYYRPWASQQSDTASIAVLPFQNRSPQKEQEYFCDGLVERLIIALGHIQDLKVINRDSVFFYKDKGIPLGDIARELDVTTVLTGSVQTDGQRLRISAELVDPKTGHSLWSDHYDRQIGGIFAIQDDITLAIVEKLRPRLLGQQKARLAKQQAVDVETYQLYLRGRDFLNRRGPENLEKAIGYFTDATERDPNYALAYAGLAASHMLAPIYSPVPAMESYLNAKENVLTALQKDNSLAEAHAAMGFIKIWYEWDWKGADEYLIEASRLNPSYASAPHWLSEGYLFRERFDEAVEQMEKAVALDPVSAVIAKDLSTAYFWAGQFKRQFETADRALELDSKMIFAHYHKGCAYFVQSQYADALREFQNEVDIGAHGFKLAAPMIVLTYMRMNRPGDAKDALDELLGSDEYTPPFTLAATYCALGQTQKAFELLNEAYEERDCWLCTIKLMLCFESVRSDPRYRDILRKINLED